jgi:hypothetical protein
MEYENGQPTEVVKLKPDDICQNIDKYQHYSQFEPPCLIYDSLSSGGSAPILDKGGHAHTESKENNEDSHKRHGKDKLHNFI